MLEEVIIAGFGGQGVMVMGYLLAYAAMREGKNVSWIPSYGPEMRGGTANCSVVISRDSEVASPIVSEPTTLIAMNRPSLDKFERMLVPGGLLVVNASLVDREPERRDIDILKVPANDIANELGNMRVANMVVLGAFVARRGCVEPASVIGSLEKVLPPHHHDLIPLNEEAFARGAGLASLRPSMQP
ncbi:MAG TPA: 2-oxoacid:ferredoxin oxidoreductase subunit gamma [Firmicutes bacterium]|nr:2-oxoacid:ferredoxin oxidoreductase subunit gamma [Bacillota bacterium]